MGCRPAAPVRPLTPEEKIERDKRDFVATCMVGGIFGFVVLLGLGQTALQLKTWRKNTARPKQPWEREPF